MDHLFIAHYQKILDEVKEFRDEVEKMYSKYLVDPSLVLEKEQEALALLIQTLSVRIKAAIDGEIPSLFDL